MTASETREPYLDSDISCPLPSLKPYPRPGGRAMLLLPIAYVAMGVCYFLALRSPTNGFWYPPIAFGKLLLLVYGPCALLPVLVSELTLMVVQYVLVAKVGFLAAGMVSLATTVEALVAWWLLRRWPVDAGLRRSDDVLRLLVYGGLIPNCVGALLGILLLRAFVDYGSSQIAPAALLWAFGDFVTTVTWMPAFVLWVAPLLCGKGMGRRLPGGKQLFELVLILLAAAATCVYVAVGMMQRPHLQEYNLKFLCFLPVIWAGIRFGLPGATASLAVASTAWAMLYGNARPLNLVDLAVTIEQVQVFNLALGIGGLMLGWAIDAERRARDVAHRLSDDLQANEARLREAFDAIAAAHQRADRAGEIKYRLLSAVSHELRTPLTPMALVLSEVAKRTDVPAEVRESAEMAMRQVETEAAIVEELLEYADLMCGAEMHRTETTWQSMTAPLWDMIERVARDADVRLSWTMPDARSHLCVDERKLKRAILHTIRHAIALSRPGGEVQVFNSIENDRLKMVCRVCTPKDGSVAGLEPFSSTDQKLSSANGGLGLGLAAARIIAERHNGSLRIAQSPEDHVITCTLMIA